MRINHGWRAARTPGFVVDFESGEVVLKADSNASSPPSRRPQRLETVRLAVQDTQNLLLIHPADPALFRDRTFETTFLYALARGLEETFQLEENELAAEMVGRDEHRAILLYETAEGGSGVLRRLVEENDALARVAAQALERCHFDAAGHDQNPACVAACYECLMSYNNQMDALFLNRHRIVETLLALTHSRVLPDIAGRSYAERLAWLRSLTDARSELERRFLEALAQGGHRLPDDAQHAIPEPRCVADFFYAPDVCVFCDGAVHDAPEQRRADAALRKDLRARGYRVVVIRYDRPLEEQIQSHSDLFSISAR